MRNRRLVRTRDPVELRAVLFVSAIAIALIVLTIVASPLSGIWISPLSAAMLTGLSLGLITPANFPYILIVTVAFLVPTAFVWRWSFRSLRARTAAGRTLWELKALPPDQFEEWVAARFEDLGYSVRVTGMQGDHGVDILAEKPGQIAVVQCNKYKDWHVGEAALRDLFGAMHDFGADRAYLVTTGQLSRPAAKWVVGKPIEVWDGNVLARLSMRVAPTLNWTKPEHMASSFSGDLAPVVTYKCPRCDSALVKRQNRHTGEQFLGCSSYPACRYTHPLPIGRAS